ncbi:glycosyltransferase [Aurantimonas sp. HBX-1]|uniref:CgeB family protein n=1 Tax=Aurantimonas sp. HBX-1 TaxID=2906072 RepID=UPI001F2498E6|nr:glycosyltransferase [Aurantimonas sp. HBX-1]UIJ70791.1 glycosyltransferase [Aurantimonas sp. HBX-1]
MRPPFDIVVVGLTLSSSWGNGHATTFRSLLKGLDALGIRILFLERDKPWYAAHRDLPDPDFCTLEFYDEVEELADRYGDDLAGAGAVLVGSYVPDGKAVIDSLFRIAPGRVSFYDIDTPLTLARLERGDEEYLAAAQIPGFHTYFSFTGGPTLSRLENRFGAARAVALYCSVEPERYRHTGAAASWDLGYLGTYSPDRQPTLERLLIEPARRLPHKRFVVAGPQYPSDIAWPGNVDRIDHLPPAEHADFYSRQRFTLNVTRADMIAAGWSPSVRLFEAAAVGTPIVSDDWQGLSELLPDGKAIVIAHGPEDVVALLADADEKRTREMAQAARKIVLEKHTGIARATELLAALDGLAVASRSTARAGAA